MKQPTVTDTTVDTATGPVPVRLYAPTDPPSAGLVWLHGGAFKMGDLDIPEADWVAGCLAHAGIAVVSVDYRLAIDGVHFPAPSDDVLGVWRWVTETTPLGVPAQSWHIGGGSAGANLAASVTLQARDGLAPLPRSAVLIYPVLHATLPEPAPELAAQLAAAPAEVRFLESDTVELNLNYVGDPAILEHPYAFPANADDLQGLPPTLVVVSEVDDLRPSGEVYAGTLTNAGVHVSLAVETGVFHGHLNRPDEPGSWRTIARIVEWLKASASAR